MSVLNECMRSKNLISILEGINKETKKDMPILISLPIKGGFKLVSIAQIRNEFINDEEVIALEIHPTDGNGAKLKSIKAD